MNGFPGGTSSPRLGLERPKGEGANHAQSCLVQRRRLFPSDPDRMVSTVNGLKPHGVPASASTVHRPGDASTGDEIAELEVGPKMAAIGRRPPDSSSVGSFQTA